MAPAEAQAPAPAEGGKIRDLEAKYIKLLESRIAVLEEQVHKQPSTATTAWDETGSFKAARKTFNSENAWIGRDEDVGNGLLHHLRSPGEGTNASGTGPSSPISESNDGLAMQRSPRIRYREERYNEFGLVEETEVRGSKNSKLQEGPDPKHHAMTVIWKYKKDNSYDRMTIRLDDSYLRTLLLFCFADDPFYKHDNYAAVLVEDSPFETPVFNWNKLKALSELDESSEMMQELRKEIARSKEKSIEKERWPLLGGIEAFQKEENLQSAARDLGIFMTQLRESEDLKTYFEREQKIQLDGKVSSKWLWTLFRPGTPVVTTTFTKEPQILIVHDCFKVSEKKCDWALDSWTYDWNGSSFNRVMVQHEFERFKDIKGITSLPIYPLKYHKNPEELEDQLYERGQMFCNLCSDDRKRRVAEYEGPAIIRGNGFRNNKERLTRPSGDSIADTASVSGVSGVLYRSKQDTQLRRKNIRGRVMVDVKSYLDHGPVTSEIVPMGGFTVNEPNDWEACACELCGPNLRLRLSEKSYYDGATDTKKFDRYQFIMCPARIYGYYLMGKEWVELDVSRLKLNDAPKDPKALEVVEMNKIQRKLLADLVQNHSSEPLMHDLVESKGKGLVVLLHGPPGVGKTLTAERLALTTGKPVFSVNVSDIGINASEAERNLKTLFELAGRWKAIMLFDEADVFLESRGSNNADLQRNALVTVLLRALEYYNGILILTTNRIRTMDVAVQSRINIAIRYKELDKQQKRNIYLNFINQLSEDQDNKQELIEWIDSEEHEGSPFEKLNGRQIRNVLFSAASLAVGSNGKGQLSLKEIERVLRDTNKFQEDVQYIMDSARAASEVGYSARSK